MQKRRVCGFLMLEVVFAICVLSIVTAMGLSKMKMMRTQKKHETIQQNYEIIRCSISAFLFRNNRLPCPADSIASGCEQRNLRTGYVPYKTLCLPKNCVVDTDGNAIYYTPHPELTGNFLYINYDPDKDVQIDDSQSFCHTVRSNPIILTHNAVDEHGNFVIAYVLSDKRPIDNGGLINIEVTEYTSWITRDLLLTRYLKMSPCKCIKPNTHININDLDDLF